MEQSKPTESGPGADSAIDFNSEELAPGLWRIRAAEPEAFTPCKLARKSPRWEQLKALPTPLVNELPTELSIRSTPRGISIAYAMDRDEDIFGMGLQLKSFRQTGKRRYLKVNSDPVADTGESHAPVPWFLSTAGYGVYIDTARYVTAYLGSHRYKSDVPVGSLKDHAFQAEGIDVLYGWRNFEPRRFLAEVPLAKGLDIYVFRADSILEVVRKYVLFSGGGSLPPLSYLGVLYRVWGKSDQEHVLKIAREFREQGIPCDTVGFEPGWHSHSYSCTYAWNQDRFPEPGLMLGELIDLDYKVNMWEHAFVHPQCAAHKEMEPNSADISVWDGLIPDLVNDEARVLLEKAHEPLIDMGVTGFKLDECDNSDYLPYPWSYPDFTTFPSGIDGEQMHQMMGWFYQQTIEGLFRRYDRRCGLQVRSAYALNASYSGVLYSDLYDHGDFMRGVVNAGMSGLLWTPEVRQCQSMEDLMRRLQTTVLSGQVCVNAWMIPHAPWKQFDRDKNRAGEFLPDWESWSIRVKELFELRMALLPYLYSAYARYYEQGIPPIRPLLLDYPDLDGVRECEDQWLIGDDLLAAPLKAGQTQRAILLPPGRWLDYSSRKVYEGGQAVDYVANEFEFPLLIRENTLLPLATPIQSVNETTVFDISVWIFGDTPREAGLFSDDGVSYGWERGQGGWLSLSHNGKCGVAKWDRGEYPRRYCIKDWIQIS